MEHDPICKATFPREEWGCYRCDLIALVRMDEQERVWPAREKFLIDRMVEQVEKLSAETGSAGGQVAYENVVEALRGVIAWRTTSRSTSAPTC